MRSKLFTISLLVIIITSCKIQREEGVTDPANQIREDSVKPRETNAYSVNYLKENNIKGNVIQYSEAQFFNADTTIKTYETRQEYDLDAEGYLIEMRHYGGDGQQFITKETHTYDGNKETISIFNFRGVQISWVKTTTEVQGNTMIKKSCGQTGQLSHLEYSTFNENKDLTEGKYYDAHRKYWSKGTYQYDDNHHVKEEYSYDMGQKAVYSKTDITYDTYGNVISRKTIPLSKDNKNDIYKSATSYIYDKHGNWIIKFDYEGDDKKPFMREERKYVYK